MVRNGGGRGLSNVGHYGWLTPKNKNKKHWLKHPKITHFTIQFRSKNVTHFINSLGIENNMLSQHSQKPF